MLGNQIRTGHVVGTGSALNVSLGWIPDYVQVINLTDGDKINVGFLGKAVVFTSGGTFEVKRGMQIVGATSGAKGRVNEVVLTSGSWAGGDAAGSFIIRADELTGTFGSENVNVGSDSNVATVVTGVERGVDIDTDTASTTGNASITSYVGSASAEPGFTLGSTISESAKVLAYLAIRN